MFEIEKQSENEKRASSAIGKETNSRCIMVSVNGEYKKGYNASPLLQEHSDCVTQIRLEYGPKTSIGEDGFPRSASAIAIDGRFAMSK